ncbi:MAG TPA: hypothetical protein DCG49_05700 [Ruminococcus sp.]|nr:hypothetical protein [Ruminococcus sp.]
MLTQITIPFESKENIRYSCNTASLFHGLLMEQLSADYAEKLHENALRPFSQNILPQDAGGIWTVSILTAEDAEKLVPAVTNLKTAEMLQKNDVLTFGAPEQQSVSYSDLFRRHYIMSDAPRLIRLHFETPTAFKSGGQYANMPSAKLILSGLAKRYDHTCGIHDTIYETLFDEMEQRVTISGFRIRSASFSLEGVRIPAFLGEITLRVSGNPTFRSYINMICDYAQYSGVGIKTALGMGRVKYEPIKP